MAQVVKWDAVRPNSYYAATSFFNPGNAFDVASVVPETTTVASGYWPQATTSGFLQFFDFSDPVQAFPSQPDSYYQLGFRWIVQSLAGSSPDYWKARYSVDGGSNWISAVASAGRFAAASTWLVASIAKTIARDDLWFAFDSVRVGGADSAGRVALWDIYLVGSYTYSVESRKLSEPIGVTDARAFVKWLPVNREADPVGVTDAVRASRISIVSLCPVPKFKQFAQAKTTSGGQTALTVNLTGIKQGSLIHAQTVGTGSTGATVDDGTNTFAKRTPVQNGGDFPTVTSQDHYCLASAGGDLTITVQFTVGQDSSGSGMLAVTVFESSGSGVWSIAGFAQGGPTSDAATTASAAMTGRVHVMQGRTQTSAAWMSSMKINGTDVIYNGGQGVGGEAHYQYSGYLIMAPFTGSAVMTSNGGGGPTWASLSSYELTADVNAVGVTDAVVRLHIVPDPPGFVKVKDTAFVSDAVHLTWARRHVYSEYFGMKQLYQVISGDLNQAVNPDFFLQPSWAPYGFNYGPTENNIYNVSSSRAAEYWTWAGSRTNFSAWCNLSVNAIYGEPAQIGRSGGILVRTNSAQMDGYFMDGDAYAPGPVFPLFMGKYNNGVRTEWSVDSFTGGGKFLISAVGSKITFFMDNIRKFETFDSDFAGGGIAFYNPGCASQFSAYMQGMGLLVDTGGGLSDAVSYDKFLLSTARVISDSIGVTDARRVLQTYGVLVTLSENVGFQDAIAKIQSFRRYLSEVPGVTDSAGRKATAIKWIADAFGVSDSSPRKMGYVRGAADLVNVPQEQVQGGIHHHLFSTRVVQDSVGAPDSAVYRKDMIRRFMDDLGIADSRSAVQAFVRRPADNLGLTDSTWKAQAYRRILSDPAGVSDATVASMLAVLINRYLSEGIGVEEASRKIMGLSRSVPDAVGLTDAESVLRSFLRVVSEAAGLTDAQGRALVVSRILSEGVGLPSASGRSMGHRRGQNEGIGVGDSMGRLVARILFLSESLGLTDAQVRKLNYIRAVADQEGAADALARVFSFVRVQPEGVGVQDQASRGLRVVKAITESLGISDFANSFLILNAYVRVLSESVGLVDQAKGLRLLIRVLSEVAGVTDASRITKAMIRGLTELLGPVDSPGRSVSYLRRMSDQVGAADFSVALAIHLVTRAIADTLSVPSAHVRIIGRGRTVADAVGVSDFESRFFSAIRRISDEAGLSDAQDLHKAMLRNIGESVGVVDTPEKFLAIVRRMAEVVGIEDRRFLDQVIGGFYLVREIAEAIGVSDEQAARMFSLWFISISLSAYGETIRVDEDNRDPEIIELGSRDATITVGVKK
jgi:hypothetical protein